MSGSMPLFLKGQMRGKGFKKARMKTSLLSGETPESKQAQVFKTIQQKSGLNQRQVRAQYEEFMKICPNGTMTKKEVRRTVQRSSW